MNARIQKCYYLASYIILKRLAFSAIFYYVATSCYPENFVIAMYVAS